MKIPRAICTTVVCSLPFTIGIPLVPTLDTPMNTPGTRGLFVDCVPAPILPPITHCRRLLKELYEYSQRYPTNNITWGRTIMPSGPNDPTMVNLPWGFQLVSDPPDPEAIPNNCEVHIDNEVDRLETVEKFDLKALVFAGLYVTDICMQKRLAGKGYPGPKKNVYVSTIYTPGHGAPGRTILRSNFSSSTSRTMTYLNATGQKVENSAFSVPSLSEESVKQFFL